MSLFLRAYRDVYRLRPRVARNSMLAQTVQFAMLSHPGRVRKGNEDTCAAAVELGAFVVCDGMGGAAAGEVASALATQTFLEALQSSLQRTSGAEPNAIGPEETRLEQAVILANRAVVRHASSSPDLEGMGTTLVGLLYTPAPNTAHPKTPASLTLVHVGDSRCYRWREGVLTPLTLDHSLVEEQVRLGEITPREAETHPMRNIITRAIGAAPFVEPEVQRLEPRSGDLYLLASDGLTRELSDPSLAALFRGHKTPDLQALAKTLVEKANNAGGHDNITVLLLAIP